MIGEILARIAAAIFGQWYRDWEAGRKARLLGRMEAEREAVEKAGEEEKVARLAGEEAARRAPFEDDGFRRD